MDNPKEITVNDKDKKSSKTPTNSSDSQQGGGGRSLRWGLIAVCAIFGALMLFDAFDGADPKSPENPGPVSVSKPTYTKLAPDVAYYDAYFKNDFAKEARLMTAIRNALVSGEKVQVEKGSVDKSPP
jgi:hypothetical protein